MLAAAEDRRPLSVALIGNAAEVVPELARSDFPADIVTDQTSAHDPATYIPAGLSLEEAADLRQSDLDEYLRRARASMAAHVEGMVAFLDRGAEVFDYGNGIRAEAEAEGFARAFDYPGFVPAYIRPLFCEGKGPFRWAALSGDPADIGATDKAVIAAFPEAEELVRWIRMAEDKVAFQGLPARICWLGYGERSRAGLAFNDLVARGEVSAPIVIGRDHLDSGSVASPYRETEAMLDGSDAIADWPILNALLNTASGASWVSVHHGGGVGIGRSIHSGTVAVADGTELAAEKLERVLTNDPGTGVMRHADAGYERARTVARERGVWLPSEGIGPPGAAREPRTRGPSAPGWTTGRGAGFARRSAHRALGRRRDHLGPLGAPRTGRRRGEADRGVGAAGLCERPLARVPPGAPRPERDAHRATSGPGATSCTRWQQGSSPTRTRSSPRRSTPRCFSPATRASASSTTSTTGTAVSPTRRIRTRWAWPFSRRRRGPASG